MARDYLRVKYCDKHNGGYCNGAFVPPFYFSERFFEIYSNMVAPTETEYLIFKFLVFCTKSSVYADVGSIRDYCFSGKGGDSNVIAAHISSLNKKIHEAYGKKIIKSRRFKGYYIEKI
ncbi:MAG: helix-turn-helix domain-containing protein [Ruminococcaceae bacterium]|nr:helix-turn-helix domain-containing protein [Oscillospiraceae bacterium]